MKIGDLVKVRIWCSHDINKPEWKEPIGVVTRLLQKHRGRYPRDFRHWNEFAIEMLPLGKSGKKEKIFPSEIVEVINENR